MTTELETTNFMGFQPDRELMLAYGFTDTGGGYYLYQTNILNDQFTLRVHVHQTEPVTSRYKLTTEVIDNETHDIFNLHRVPGATGSFVGAIRQQQEQIVQQIIDSCFVHDQAHNQYAVQIMQYIKQKYDGRLEYLWPKSPNNAICRRKDNAKWYLVMLTIKTKQLLKITTQSSIDNQPITIINLRIPPKELDKILDHHRYFRGYHMNKQRWVTICLDGRVSMEEIYQHIDQSYDLAN